MLHLQQSQQPLTHGVYACCVAGKDHSKVLDEHVSTFMDKAKQVSAQVQKAGSLLVLSHLQCLRVA